MNHPDIIIPDRIGLERKLSRFSKHNVQPIFDFDGTMTRPNPTSWAMLTQLESLMPGYNQAAKELHAIYHPYESDNTLSKEKKNQLMQEWWSKAAWLFSTHKIKAEYLRDINAGEILLRDGMREAFDFFRTHNIPVYILSAWVHQSIEMILSYHDITWDHIRLTANQFVFDTEGNYSWFHPEQHIHAGNKAEHRIDNMESNSKDKMKLIAWDNRGDIVVSPDERENTIAIGFCHHPKNWTVYAENFDIVIHSETSDLGVFNWVFNKIS